MLYRNRIYHPTLGRFLQRDPIGYRAGDVNLVRYVGNRAVVFSDPKGHGFWDDYWHYFYQDYVETPKAAIDYGIDTACYLANLGNNEVANDAIGCICGLLRVSLQIAF